MYAGTRGSTHGDRNDSSPPAMAIRNVTSPAPSRAASNVVNEALNRDISAGSSPVTSSRPNRMMINPLILAISNLYRTISELSSANAPPNSTTKMNENPSTNDTACRNVVKRCMDDAAGSRAGDNTCCDIHYSRWLRLRKSEQKLRPGRPQTAW